MERFARVYINVWRAFVTDIDIFNVLACFLLTLKLLYFLNYLAANNVTVLQMQVKKIVELFRYKKVRTLLLALL